MSSLMEVISPTGPTVASAAGHHLYDSAGRPYLDWWSNSGCASLGYWPSELHDVWEQATMLPQFIAQSQGFAIRDQLAKDWCGVTGMDSVFLTNSGTEAVETAIKLLRAQAARAGRVGFIYTVADSFHGRTYGALAAGDGPDYHYDGFGPHLSGFKKFRRPDEIKWSEAIGVLMTPLQCYKDSYHFTSRWWNELRTGLRANPQVGLAYDDIQTGAGRCGEITMDEWSGAHCDVEADIVCLGKGVALGLPLSMTLARGDYADALAPGSHFCTFGGASVPPMLASIKMLEWLVENLTALKERAEWFRAQLLHRPWLEGLRGAGMMWSFDTQGATSAAMVEAAREVGLIVTAWGTPVKIYPPLNSERADLLDGLERLDEAYKRAMR